MAARAGIVDSPTTIIEMSKSGIGRNNLLIKNVDLVYKVYRCIFPDVAAGATETAKMMFDGVQAKEGMKIRYDAVGALGSIWARKVIPKGFGLDINYQLDHLMGARGAAYFCSGHVVLCYQAALSQMKMAGQSLFPIQDAGKVFTQEAHCYQPSFLEKILRESRFFTKLGKFRGVVRIGPGDD